MLLIFNLKKQIIHSLVLIFLILLFFPFNLAAGSALPSYYLITNAENDKNQFIKRRTLRAIYSMRTQSWPNGDRLTVFVLADDEVLHEEFCQQVLGVLPYQLRKSWDRLIFSGRAGAPIKVQNLDEMKAKVAETPGAIGYITQNYIDESIVVLEVK